MSLLTLLQELSRSTDLPMHMPGHKRNSALAPYLDTLGAALDITEIHGFGNLHTPEGLLADRMTQAAQLWGSRKAWWLIGGSTAGILAAIDAATKGGDKVLIARNCHKSVYNACMLCGLETAYIQPELFPYHSFANCITPAQVEEALTAHPDTRLVVLTSPTYEGLMSDITPIAEIVHRHGAVLMVDEAHGAHFGLHPDFPASAVTQGADIVVQSLHKTLPSLTQTALLHLCSDRIDQAELGFRLSVYQTSSPSYLLMASIDSCVELVANHKNTLFPQWSHSIRKFYEALRLRHLHLPLNGIAEPSKLLISTVGTNITGPALAQKLRAEYNIEAEMSTADTVLCMTGMGDTDETLLTLANALNRIDADLTDADAAPMPSLPLPQQVMPIHAATKQETIMLPLDASEGRIAGDFLWAYPPGIPLSVPGERITPALTEYIRSAAAKGVDIAGAKSTPENFICVLKDVDEFNRT